MTTGKRGIDINITDVDFDVRQLPWRGSRIANTTRAGDNELGDLLATMFEAQRELMLKYHDIEGKNGHLVVGENELGDLNSRQVQTRIKDLMWRMTEEMCEASQCLKNRPHKTTYVETDVPHFKEELADAFHYLLELLITAGMDADELFELYFRKLEVNLFRQRSNY